MKSLKLSVVMPNYNHAQYIKEALATIVGQSFQPYEVIICDDASTDKSAEIIQEFADRYPFIRFIRNQTNLGGFESANMLIDMVSGDYLYTASADDRILPGFFEKSMNLLMQYPQAGISSALSFIIDEHGRKKNLFLAPIISKNPCFYSAEKVRDIFLKRGSWIVGLTTILKLDYFRENGGYMSELCSFADGFIEELLALKYGACFIPEPLTCWRQLGDNYTMATSNNPETYAKLINNVTSLMQARSSGIFPKEYVEAWRRQYTFYLHYNIYKKMHREKIAEISILGKTMGFIGKLWVSGFKLFFSLERVLILSYLFFVFKKTPWRMCRNRIISFIIRCRYEFQKSFTKELL